VARSLLLALPSLRAETRAQHAPQPRPLSGPAPQLKLRVQVLEKWSGGGAGGMQGMADDPMHMMHMMEVGRRR
jgi:hypothetical protein